MHQLALGISHALQALDALAARLDEATEAATAIDAKDCTELIALLERLILKRVETTRAFHLLLKLDVQKCQQLLLRRYLGRHVSPDTKFGGYESELATMLSDLTEIHTPEALRQLVRQENFDWSKLDDSRVERAMCEALSLETHESLEAWLSEARAPRAPDE
jgi:hypothetical protein